MGRLDYNPILLPRQHGGNINTVAEIGVIDNDALYPITIGGEQSDEDLVGGEGRNVIRDGGKDFLQPECIIVSTDQVDLGTWAIDESDQHCHAELYFTRGRSEVEHIKMLWCLKCG